jgi:hypothetical protein
VNGDQARRAFSILFAWNSVLSRNPFPRVTVDAEPFGISVESRTGKRSMCIGYVSLPGNVQFQPGRAGKIGDSLNSLRNRRISAPCSQIDYAGRVGDELFRGRIALGKGR